MVVRLIQELPIQNPGKWHAKKCVTPAAPVSSSWGVCMSHRGWFAALVLLSGCSARSQVSNAAPDAGLVRSYAASFDKVQGASRAALAEISLPVSEERWLDRTRWSVLATPGVAVSIGRIVRIIVEDHPTDCRVWVLAQIKPDAVEEELAEELQGRIARLLGHESLPERPAAGGAGEKEDRYRSPLARCADLAAKACRDRGFAIVRVDPGDGAVRTIAAERRPSGRMFVALYRLSPEATRVVVEVRGGTPEENGEEASAVHRELLKELQPER